MESATDFDSNSGKERFLVADELSSSPCFADPLLYVFESTGSLCIMTGTLRKRRPESEALSDSIDVGEPKRLHAKETVRSSVNRVMKSFEEKISATCSTSYTSSNSRNNSKVSNISNDHGGQTLVSESAIDLCYLLEASDDQLGIPQSVFVDLKHEVCECQKETSNGLLESLHFKSIGENLHFKEDYENYQQFAMYEDAWDARDLPDYMNRDCQPKHVI